MARRIRPRMEVVGLRVRNLDRSLRFYTRALGLRVLARGDTRSWGGGLWVRLVDPRSRRVVELNWYPRRSIFGGAFRPGDGVDHIDFTIGVAPVAALERAYRALVRGGGRPTGFDPSTTEGWMASVRDPDGVWIRVGRDPSRAELAAIRAARAR